MMDTKKALLAKKKKVKETKSSGEMGQNTGIFDLQEIDLEQMPKKEKNL